MSRWHVKAIAEIDQDEIWGYPDEDVEVEFDNGEIRVMSWREVIVSQYFWDIQRDFPEVPILPQHAVIGKWNKGTPEDILSAVRKTISEQADFIDKEYIMKNILVMRNRFYNGCIMNTQEYTTSISGFDIAEIVESPEYQAIVDNLEPTHASIQAAYEQSHQLLKDGTWMMHNPMKRSNRFGVVNEQQYNQVAVARGFVTDINNVQFNEPILTGYARGLHRLHDFSIETRSAAKAVQQQKDPIADTEYFNRRLQIGTEIIRYLFEGDCGSEHFIRFHLNKGNFATIVGSYIEDPETGQLICVEESDKKRLTEFKIVRVRSALGCKFLSKYGICETCLGKYAQNVPRDISIGHLSATITGEKMAQTVLSTKHLDKSIEVKKFKMTREDAKYFEVVGKEGKHIRIKPEWLGGRKGVELLVNHSSLSALADIAHSNESSNVHYSRLTVVEEVGLKIPVGEREGDYDYYYAKVSDVSRTSFFTADFLDYILELPDLPREGKSMIALTLDDWDPTVPILELPLKRDSMVDYLNSFSNQIENQLAKLKVDVNTEEGMSDAFMTLFDVVDEFVQVPVTYLAILMSATLVRDRKNGDYRLPTYESKREFATVNELFRYRSLSAAMAYEQQYNAIVKPFSITYQLRANHPFDASVIPSIGNVYQEDKH